MLGIKHKTKQGNEQLRKGNGHVAVPSGCPEKLSTR